MALTLADINNKKIRSDPPPTKWTFEDMDKYLKQAKALLQYSFRPYKDLSSMRVGGHQQEVEFLARAMRNHSRYFFAFVIPTTCYMDQFLEDTRNVMSLNKSEVEAFEFVIGWCHEGGVPNGENLYRRYKMRSLHQWVCTWRVADLLGVPILQHHITKAVMLEMAANPQLPEGMTVHYLYSNLPYKQREDFLWQTFLVLCARAPGTEIDLMPKHFPKQFVEDVNAYRRIHGLKKPGEITALTPSPGRHLKAQAKDDTYWEYLQKHRDKLAIHLSRRRSMSALNQELGSVSLKEKPPKRRLFPETA